jgi:hypothetical protein
MAEWVLFPKFNDEIFEFGCCGSGSIDTYGLKEQEGKALDLKVYINEPHYNMRPWITWWIPGLSKNLTYPNGDIVLFETKELAQEYAELMLKL